MTEDWPKMCKAFVVFNFITYTVGKGQKPQDGNMRKKKQIIIYVLQEYNHHHLESVSMDKRDNNR